MILKNISIANFRAATDVNIPFSYDDDNKNVTVIRAENKTGKTTILNALLWGMFGEEGLPNNYRIANLNNKANDTVNIEVAIDFQHTRKISQNTGRSSVDTSNFRLIRKIKERIDGDGNYQRDPKKEDLRLFKITSSGSDNLGNPQETLNYMLGSDVKNLFFTNGDDTLNFIQSTSRKTLVRNAIKDMMSFDVVENAIKHIGDVGKELLKEAKTSTQDLSVSEAASHRLDIKTKLEEQQKELNNFNNQLKINSENKKQATLEYEEAAKLAKKSEYIQKQKQEISVRKSLEDDKKNLSKEHAKYIYSSNLSNYLLKEKFQIVSDINTKLMDDGFPKASAPYLKKVLKQQKCICGKDFKENDDCYSHINQLIKEISDASPTIDRLRELDTSIKNKGNLKHLEIMEALKNVYEKDYKYDENIEKLNHSILARDEKIKKIPDVDFQEIKERKEGFDRAEYRLSNQITIEEIKVNDLKKDLKQAEADYERIISAQGEITLLNTKLSAVSDLNQILEGVYKDIENVEIPKVAEHLNEFFLKMIATEEGKGDALSGATIDDYQIQVIGPNGKYVNIDNALNGASLRSLTISFVLSLTKVCEFEAPNIIDTPFGMMSPNEKLLVLQTLKENSNQLILFLTRSEINDIENLLDEYVGSTTTMINTSKLSELKNKPDADKNTILICECNYRNECTQCAHIHFGENQ